MCKHLRDILFPLNILGANLVPGPESISQTIIRSTISTFEFSPTFDNGSLQVQYTKTNGQPTTISYSPSSSGYVFTLNVLPGSKIYFGENLKLIQLMDGVEVDYISFGYEMGNGAAILYVNSNALISGIMDLRNIRNNSLISLQASSNSVSKIYTYANYNISLLTNVINRSTATNGVLYINTRGQYAPPLIQAAAEKGWTIRNIYG